VNHAAVTQVHPITTQGIGVRNRGHHAGSLEIGQKLLACASDTTDRLGLIGEIRVHVRIDDPHLHVLRGWAGTRGCRPAQNHRTQPA
jgi:hypothetical protein